MKHSNTLRHVTQFVVAASLTAFTANAVSADGYGARGGAVYDTAKVVNVTPLYERVQFSVPREECFDERVERRSTQYAATGPILGAIIGGALGNAVGHNKSNKRVGTVAGAALGAAVGYDVSRRNGAPSSRYETQQVCRVSQEVREEERLSGYQVTYRYAGETYTTRMPRDPGARLRVRVAVTPAE